jgi:hypothetical protein
VIRGALDGPYLGEKTRRFSRRFDLTEPRGGGGFDAFLPPPDPLLVLDGTRDARARVLLSRPRYVPPHPPPGDFLHGHL